MYVDYSLWETFEYTINSLNLDLNNPRLKYRGVVLNQTQILKFLIEKEKVYELARKISEEGYFVGEEPIICIENNKKIVLEGNRRVAALKLLQEPKKYLPTSKANVLLKNITTNNFPTDKKLKCFISPNRILANPIIYSRHNGVSLRRWETGNQYAFVAEMYYEDGLSIDDICDVLNESKSKILKPLKAYNLFREGQEVLSKDGVSIEIDAFEFTNLERFYDYEDGRKFLGIIFNEGNGELTIKIPNEEYEKRLLFIFKKLIDAERFSRDFNKEEQKKEYISDLKKNPDFDFSVEEDSKHKSRTSKDRANLDDKRNNITTRRKNPKKRIFEYSIIPRDVSVDFDNDKLNDLFVELKSLPIDRKYSFAILLRTYLEQALFHYIDKKSLSDEVNKKSNEERKKNGLAKVNTLISHIRGKYGVKGDMDSDAIMSILKFDGDKDYSSGLKSALDFIKNNELDKFGMETNLLKNTKQYLENVKNELDLAVHNINYTIDTTHNKRAWNTLHPLFEALCCSLNNE